MAQDLTQWEYRMNYPKEDELNKLGEQGWEVAGIDSTAAPDKKVLLKRPKQPQQQPSRPKDDGR